MTGRVVIVGGGISGLSTAYYLAKAGIPSTVVERRPRLGGVIQTERIHGCVLEAGPDSFISAKPAAMELIHELSLGGDVISSNDHLRVTYIVKNGKLIPMPDGLMMMVPTRILPMAASSLLSWPTKIRMGLEWFRSPNSKLARDRSVSEFIEDHYGSEAVDYLAEPLLAGVYGGDPNQLSVNSVLTRFVELEKKYGSLTKGVLTARKHAAGRSSESGSLFRTLKNGLGQMIDALVAAIGDKMEVIHGTVETVEPGYRMRVNGEWIDAAHVVLASQAYEVGALIEGFAPELNAQLAAVPYSSSITLALGYDKRELNHPLNGFGFLVPKKERGKLVACTWVGTKFSHRVPDDQAVLRCFLGGMDHGILADSDEDVIASVRGELRAIMGVTATPRFHQIARWPRAMAQYTVGHEKRVETIQSLLAKHSGLYLAGNAYYGIGIPDCIKMGRQAAAKIAQRP